MNQETFQLILDSIIKWSEKRSDIFAVALAGSWARGTQHSKSDVDFVFIVHDPLLFKSNSDWLSEIDWNGIGGGPTDWNDQDYGKLWSRHTIIAPDIEIEFGFASLSWMSVSPIDQGTESVVKDGFRILVDKEGGLKCLCAACGA